MQLKIQLKIQLSGGEQPFLELDPTGRPLLLVRAMFVSLFEGVWVFWAFCSSLASSSLASSSLASSFLPSTIKYTIKYTIKDTIKDTI